jgi:hypothetical protein
MFKLVETTAQTSEPMILAEHHDVPVTFDMSCSSVRLDPSKTSR